MSGGALRYGCRAYADPAVSDGFEIHAAVADVDPDGVCCAARKGFRRSCDAGIGKYCDGFCGGCGAILFRPPAPAESHADVVCPMRASSDVPPPAGLRIVLLRPGGKLSHARVPVSNGVGAVDVLDGRILSLDTLRSSGEAVKFRYL